MNTHESKLTPQQEEKINSIYCIQAKIKTVRAMLNALKFGRLKDRERRKIQFDKAFEALSEIDGKWRFAAGIVLTYKALAPKELGIALDSENGD